MPSVVRTAGLPNCDGDRVRKSEVALAVLASDTSPNVRKGVARRANLDIDILNPFWPTKTPAFKQAPLQIRGPRGVSAARGTFDSAKAELESQRRPVPRTRSRLIEMAANTRAEI